MSCMAVTNEEYTRISDKIDKIALSISLADTDEKFEESLRRSLICILRYLSQYEEHRKKLMELLGDVTRRLKCRRAIQLPVLELLLSYNDDSSSVFLINFSHMYLRLGYPRLPVEQQAKLLPSLLSSLSEDKPVCQRDALLHITLPFIGIVTPQNVPKDLGLSEISVYRRYVTDFYSLVMLTPYCVQRLIRFDGSDTSIPDGFNAYDLGRVFHERYSSITSAEELEKCKADIVKFYSHQFFPPEESIIPILFGLADSRHSVVSLATKELKNLSMIVDWEDELLLSRIMNWYLGRRREFDPKGRTEARRPLSANTRVKVGHYLLRSRVTFPGVMASSLIEAAMLALDSKANGSESAIVQGQQQQQQQQQHQQQPQMDQQQLTAPGGIDTILSPDSTYAPTSRLSFEESTQSTSVVLNQQSSPITTASSLQLRRLTEHGVDLLTHLLNNMTTLSGAASMAALRCLINFVYERTSPELTVVRARGFQLLSLFLLRDPNYLLKDPAQLPRLFDVLAQDNPLELKLATAHCLMRLAITFQEAQRQNHPALRLQLGKLERLLYENIEKPDPLCRLVAVNYAGLIYPSDHIPTRYLILQSLGDKDPRVRTEACLAFEQFLDPSIIHDIVYGRVKLPSFVEFVNHDTQHSRKNPFVEVERLIPVVQFIRLCLLATRGGLTPAQEVGLNYETEDEVRYVINQTVRYFLSVGSNCTSTNASAQSNGTNGIAVTLGNSTNATQAASSGTTALNPEQAKRSIDTYFRLIQVVIFTRSQHTKDSPDFPNYLEEVLVGNTKELITCNKQLFDRMNNVLLATPRGASCRHACASVYSVVVMETETAVQALQTAKLMLSKLPKAGTHVDGETSHAIQGMFMGAAYLLERLFTRHVAIESTLSATNSHSSDTTQTSSSKKSKKERQQQKQLRIDIIATIEHLAELMDPFLIKPALLFDVPTSSNLKDNKRSSDGGWYANASIAQATVAALLEALMVLGRSGCLSHLPAGTLPFNGGTVPALSPSKASLVHRIAVYLPSASSNTVPRVGNANTADIQLVWVGQFRVAQSALQALAACCMGEGTTRLDEQATNCLPKTTDNNSPCHPHTLHILKMMADMADINEPCLHIAVGSAMADCLLGSTSPIKRHWYERSYPLRVSVEAANAAVSSQAGVWLTGQLKKLLTHRPGQVQTRTATLSAAFWTLSLVRRIGPPSPSFINDRLIIDLLEEKDESVQCVAVATLGLIYDRSSEEARTELVTALTKSIMSSDKRQGSLFYRELCTLAQQIGRPDLALSLIILAIALPPNARYRTHGVKPPTATGGASASDVAANLASSVTYAGLVRRLGRSLAPALPRLVPRIFIRRFDYARPRLRQAIENVWLGLVFYASSTITPSATYSAARSTLSLPLPGAQSQEAQQPQQTQPNDTTTVSAHALASEMVEGHFNAIVCEIKTQLGLNTLNPSLALQPPSTNTTPGHSGSTGSLVTENVGSGTQNKCLRDACCLAITNLTTHPSADRRLAGHLPALLSGLLALCDEYDPALSSSLDGAQSTAINPPEEAAIAVQKLVIRVLENPCSREAAAGLLPGLLPVIIDRAPWTLGSVTEVDPVKGTRLHDNAQLPRESRRLALELLLAAARTARPSALRPALPQLVLAGLHTMSSIQPLLVVNLMRQPSNGSSTLQSPQFTASTSPSLVSPSTPTNSAATSVLSHHQTGSNNSPVTTGINRATTCKEVQMSEVLRLCVRLIDDVCLSRLIVPFTELIRAGAGPCMTSSASGGSRGIGASESATIATATCIFLSQLAAANASTLAAVAATSRVTCATCMRCSSTGMTNAPSNGVVLGTQKPYTSPCGSTQSSPSSVRGISPPATAVTSADVGTVYSSSPYATTDTLPGIGHRCRSGVLPTQKYSNGPSTVTSPSLSPPGNIANQISSASPSSSGTGNTGTGCSSGGGFASLVPHTGKLLAALLYALPAACRHTGSTGTVVQVEMARTLACLLRFAKETSVAKVYYRLQSWFIYPEPLPTSDKPSTSSISISHWACARVLHAVLTHCPESLFAHAFITLPTVFLNNQCTTDYSNYAFRNMNRSSVLGSASSPNGYCSPMPETAQAASNRPTDWNTTAKADENAQSEMDVYRQLCGETWKDLTNKIPKTSWPVLMLSLSPLTTITPGWSTISTPSHCPFAVLLRRPVLDHCLHFIADALQDSQNWFVRTQAALALVQLAIKLMEQPAHPVCQALERRKVKTPVRSKTTVDKDGTVVSYTADVIDTTIDGEETSSADVADATAGEDKPVPSSTTMMSPDLKTVENFSDEADSIYNTFIALTQTISTALLKVKPWPGKINLLRAVHFLYSMEQCLSVDLEHQDIIKQMWYVLVRETNPKRNKSDGSVYTIEAYIALASFMTAFNNERTLQSCLRCASPAECVLTDEEKPVDECDHFTGLFTILIPQWTKREKTMGPARNLVWNAELTEVEQELAVRAVGMLWPISNLSLENVNRFIEVMTVINCAICHGTKRVQIAALASMFTVMIKLTPEQSTHFVESATKAGGKPFAELGFKEFLPLLKRASENSKSQLLRENVLAVISGLISHNGFYSLCREPIGQILRLYSNDGVQSLKEWSVELLKN